MMKSLIARVFFLSLCCVNCLFFAACSPQKAEKDVNTPQAVAEKYVTLVQQEKYEEAQKLICAGSNAVRKTEEIQCGMDLEKKKQTLADFKTFCDWIDFDNIAEEKTENGVILRSTVEGGLSEVHLTLQGGKYYISDFK